MVHNRGYAISYRDEDGRHYWVQGRHGGYWSQDSRHAYVTAEQYKANIMAATIEEEMTQGDLYRGDQIRGPVHVLQFK